MRTISFRGASAAALSIAMMTTTFTQAQAAPAPTVRADAVGPVWQSLNRSTLAAIAPGITKMTSACPTGQSPNVVYGDESFEAGLPFPGVEFTNGFTATTGTGAPDGSGWASSSLLASDPALIHFLTSNHDIVPQTGKLYLSFSYRGNFVAGSALALINTGVWDLAPTPEWAAVTLDITSEATTSPDLDKAVYVGFGHLADGLTAGSLDVDDLAIYSCKANPPPNLGIRGDWTGQGTVDLMATRSDGTLWVYDGKNNGSVGAGVQVGSGWSTFTWQGSPGDVNGDKRTDLLARRSDGTLWFFPGKGNGFLGRGVQVGSGWNGITAIATPGDVDLDGHPDLIARRSDGTLHLYGSLTTGRLRYVRQIGTGWNGMSSVIGMGDLNGDKRGDIVAVRKDGIMFSYLASATGLTSGRQVGTGWNGMTWLTSPGDMNKDGLGDVVGRRSNGTLWFYPGRAGGGVYSGAQVGTGWNGMRSIL